MGSSPLENLTTINARAELLEHPSELLRSGNEVLLVVLSTADRIGLGPHPPARTVPVGTFLPLSGTAARWCPPEAATVAPQVTGGA
jgi:hypothetical protein